MRDNAEGSRSSERPNLSRWQRSILVGTLLGDGCIAQHGRWHRLHIKHKAAHRALAELKRDTFQGFVSMRIHEFDQQLGGKRFPCVQFATRTHPIFSEWHSRFYREGRKIVPEDIARWMTPPALAVWFMDDGAADHWGFTLQTHSFEVEEVDLLRRAVHERFDLETRLRRNKGRWLLYVPAASVRGFKEIVGQLILPDLRYKMVPRALDPVETARRPLIRG